MTFQSLLRIATFRSVTKSPAQFYRCLSSTKGEASKPERNNEDLILSDSCVKRLNDLNQEAQIQSHLRILVEGGGCSGFQYKFELEDSKPTDEDRIIERNGAAVVIDETSLGFVKGSTIDYHTELIRSAFRIIDNPQAEDGCSCGASFSIKID